MSRITIAGLVIAPFPATNRFRALGVAGGAPAVRGDFLTTASRVKSHEPRGGTYLRAVVTGGAGFLGSHLCDYLIDRGWDVLAIDNLATGALENVSHSG